MRFKYLAVSAAAILAAGSAHAEYSGGVIKIGVLNDQSGLYADISGPGSTWAAKKAVEDYGAAKKGLKVLCLASIRSRQLRICLCCLAFDSLL